MHEMGITQSLLNIALDHAQRANATRINGLTIVVGELSSVVDDSVQFYWDFISQGTIAEKATLNFKRIPAAARCTDCGHTAPLDRETYACPACGSGSLAIVAGEEFFLESIDVDLAASSPAPEQKETSHA
ncbi:MAG TPA: hydrogenase maturation nickel metallochaperone HypA [Aggregatilinea sp.]|uniref:hydrogenase maturation nickel metallochaperone HypA n=1 Tax=Aggregatilinea sp. TaxID=2806333 RepID=UPI002C57C88C|nr:hydrogenase maturation nickel metallochaperone HypA [Aggregatilinea sp.]HML22787.1 hydrogenase maturation nickel metallochaperone HypA [Aggregatilinea sp.]